MPCWRYIKISAFIQAVVLVSFQGAGLKKIETNCNIIERRCSMIMGGIVDILPGKLSYFYMVSLTTKPVNLFKFITVTSVPNAPAWVIHARDDEPYMSKNKCQFSSPFYIRGTDRTVDAARYKLQERRRANEGKLRQWRYSTIIRELIGERNSLYLVIIIELHQTWENDRTVQKNDKSPTRSD